MYLCMCVWVFIYVYIYYTHIHIQIMYVCAFKKKKKPVGIRNTNLIKFPQEYKMTQESHIDETKAFYLQ